MIDPKTILDQLLGSKVPGTQESVGTAAGKAGQLARDNPVATGLLAAVLLGSGSGRKFTGSALKLGGLAAVAGLGYHAWENYQAGRSPEESGSEAAGGAVLPPPLDSDFSPEPDRLADSFALALVRVMIAAARADGHIDETERGRIRDKLQLSGIGDEAAGFIEAELARPIDMDALVAQARTEAQKVEMFTAARLAIEPDSRAERGFLDMLAGRLGLPDPLVDHIEATVSAAKA